MFVACGIWCLADVYSFRKYTTVLALGFVMVFKYFITNRKVDAVEQCFLINVTKHNS